MEPVQPKPINAQTARERYVARELGERPRKYASEILAFVESHTPSISESAFKIRVLPLLERILVPANRAAYQQIVVDLMMPLRVLDDNDRTKVLHTVPALARTPLTTIPQADGGLSVGDVIHNMNRYRDLQQTALIDETMQSFLNNITILPDPVDDILIPINRILMAYGRRLDLTATAENPMGTDSPTEAHTKVEGTLALSSTSDCFSEEEDDY